MVDRFLIENSFFRLDPRPFDREAICVQMEFLKDIEVLFVSVVVISRCAGNVVLRIGCFLGECRIALLLAVTTPRVVEVLFTRLPRAFLGTSLLPHGPFVSHVAFDLITRSAGAPEEAVGKSEFLHTGKYVIDYLNIYVFLSF
jgi:hypothetical protein